MLAIRFQKAQVALTARLVSVVSWVLGGTVAFAYAYTHRETDKYGYQLSGSS